MISVVELARDRRLATVSMNDHVSALPGTTFVLPVHYLEESLLLRAVQYLPSKASRQRLMRNFTARRFAEVLLVRESKNPKSA